MTNKVSPHGDIEQVFENIWFVQGQVKMPMFLPLKISKSMTIVRDPASNALTLINAMPLNDAGLKQLQSLGEIKNTLRVGGFHGRDDAFYRDKFGAKVYAIKGQTYVKKFDDVSLKPEEGYMQADVWLDENSKLPIPGASLFLFITSTPVEALLRINQDGGVLVAGDALQNTAAADRFCNLPGKYIMKKMGFYKPYNVGPGWLQIAKPSVDEVRSVLNIDFEHVLPGHGNPVIGNAKEKYRPALEGELKGARG